jgi:HPt (histidine-containing phosphotransfer) domain-containing protein
MATNNLISDDQSDNSIDPKTLDALRFLDADGTNYLGELIELYLRQSPELLAAIRSAVTRDDPPALQKSAHTLKGSSASLGATKLAAYLKELEMIGRAGSTDGTDDWIARAEAEAVRVRHALEVEMRKGSSSISPSL